MTKTHGGKRLNAGRKRLYEGETKRYVRNIPPHYHKLLDQYLKTLACVITEPGA